MVRGHSDGLLKSVWTVPGERSGLGMYIWERGLCAYRFTYIILILPIRSVPTKLALDQQGAYN